jgi:hypothetical protein
MALCIKDKVNRVGGGGIQQEAFAVFMHPTPPLKML